MRSRYCMHDKLKKRAERPRRFIPFWAENTRSRTGPHQNAGKSTAAACRTATSTTAEPVRTARRSARHRPWKGSRRSPNWRRLTEHEDRRETRDQSRGETGDARRRQAEMRVEGGDQRHGKAGPQPSQTRALRLKSRIFHGETAQPSTTIAQSLAASRSGLRGRSRSCHMAFSTSAQRQ